MPSHRLWRLDKPLMVIIGRRGRFLPQVLYFGYVINHPKKQLLVMPLQISIVVDDSPDVDAVVSSAIIIQ